MGGGGNVSGYEYYMGLHFGLCHSLVPYSGAPVSDGLLEIRCGQRTAWAGTQVGSGSFQIVNSYLFGGPQREGGIQGQIDLMAGDPTQMPNGYLTAQQGSPQPAYRGISTVVYEGGMVGANNPYPKPWSFRVRRTTAGWQGGTPWNPSQAAITLSSGVVGMNAAHIVYECLTNSDWGLGYPPSQIDTTSFLAAATQMYTEGLGLCLLWDRHDTIESFLQDIMDYIDGILITDRQTGLFNLTLLRGGYDVSTLPVYDQDNVLEFTSYEAPTITGTVNELVITYVDPTIGGATYGGEQAVSVQALGAVQAQGVVVTQKKDYPGIATADLALRIAQRDLARLSTALKKVQFKLDRNAWTLVPGDLFVLNFPAYGINSLVMRVGDCDYGSVTSSAITITSLQDVFSLPAASYVSIPVTGWAAPNGNPVVPTLFHGEEMSYRDIQRLFASNAYAATTCYDMLGVARPNGLQIYWQVWAYVSPAAPTDYANGQFTPYAQLAASCQPFDASVTLQSGLDLDEIVVGTQAIIVDTVIEVVKVTSINLTTNTLGILRGCVDTLPAAHGSGTAIFFLDGVYGGTDGVQYTPSETVEMTPAPVTGTGALNQASAPVISIVMHGRAALPYPPAYLTIAGTRWDLVTSVSGSFTVAWRERNRLTQGDQLVDQTAATVTPELNTRYCLTFTGSSGLLATMSNIGTPTATVELDYTGAVTMTLYSTNDNGNSTQQYSVTFNYTPPGGSPTNTITGTPYTPVYDGTVIDGGNATAA
jgi:hypothetical protein